MKDSVGWDTHNGEVSSLLWPDRLVLRRGVGEKLLSAFIFIDIILVASNVEIEGLAIVKKRHQKGRRRQRLIEATLQSENIDSLNDTICVNLIMDFLVNILQQVQLRWKVLEERLNDGRCEQDGL